MSEPEEKPKAEETEAPPAPPFGDGLPVWTCTLSELAEEENWTVGAKRDLRCTGDYVEKFTDSAQIVLPDEKISHALKILEVANADHTSADFVITAYRPGDFKSVPFLIKDTSNTGVKVETLQWSVASVIPQGTKPIPYGPNNPLQLPMPLWYWASIGFAALVFFLVVFLRLRKWLQRRRLLEELSSHGTALTPYNQFNKDMRQLIRKYHQKVNSKDEETKLAGEYLDAVDETFKLYLTRELLVPALEWNTGAVLGEIRRRHRGVYTEYGDQVRKLLRELRKARLAKEKIELYDCDQLAEMSRTLTGKIFQEKRK